MTALTAPILDVHSAPFWEAARAGKLMIQRCPITGRYLWYPRGHSIYAPGTVPEWVQASGRGSIFSFSTIYRGNGPIGAPYICALVQLEEEVLMLTRLVNVDIADVRVGMQVEVAFEEFSDEIRLPVFRPKGDHA